MSKGAKIAAAVVFVWIGGSLAWSLSEGDYFGLICVGFIVGLLWLLITFASGPRSIPRRITATGAICGLVAITAWPIVEKIQDTDPAGMVIGLGFCLVIGVPLLIWLAAMIWSVIVGGTVPWVDAHGLRDPGEYGEGFDGDDMNGDG